LIFRTTEYMFFQ